MVQTNVQERYRVALDALVAKLKQDRYILAAILYGSLVRGEVWEKSDIDLHIIRRDGLERNTRYLWLTEDGINIFAEVFARNQYKRMLEGTLQGSVSHSVRSQSKLLFTQDESIAAWFQESDRIGARDQDFQLLRAVSNVPYTLDKAEKWFYAKNDLNYSLPYTFF